jgi:GNAT superfamily N-acetyltransferase
VTTTLRPAGPEERGPDGTRARDFTVCVNGRPVGGLRLATDRRLGPGTGRIAALAIDEPDRRRGRGAVAALAAEEVLRTWDCRRVRARVPADAAHALRLAAALGYTERERAMAKELAGPVPAPPPGSAIRPMDEADRAAWEERTRAERVRESLAQGATPERAEAIAADALPAARCTAGTVLRVLAYEGTDVGRLWARTAGPADGPGQPWVHLIETAEPHRRHGHGRTLMLDAERECLAAGTSRLGLTVRADQFPALRLFESLGYRPTSYELAKPLI